MNPATLLEIFGYIGSALVVISMLMSSVVKLRIINVCGSIISATYAFLIGSFPLALMNVCLIVINIFNLIKLFRTEQKYDFVIGKTDDALVKFFLEHYGSDIRTYFRNYDAEKDSADSVYITCINGSPAGMTLARHTSDDTLDLIIDYSIPKYRDCSVGKYLYSKLPKYGIRKLTFEKGKSVPHESYLAKVGFKTEDGYFVKTLD